ncbi:MAG TPA: M17 family peptidase N-terminal domain-containing protein, partial [Rhizomicrobium sp.]
MEIGFAAPAWNRAGTIAVAATDEGLLPSAAAVDKATSGALRRAMEASRFKGKTGQVLELLAPSGVQASRVLLVGAGAANKFDARAAERLAAGVTARLLTGGETTLTFAVDSPKGAKMKPAELAAHLALGAQLRSYSFHKYRTKQLDEYQPTLATVTIGTEDASGAKKAWQQKRAVADGIFIARDLVNEPPNVMSPQEFAARAQALSKLG